MRDFFAYTRDLLLRGGAAIGGFFAGLTSGAGGTATLLLALMVGDYISGVVAAAMQKSPRTAHGRLSSEAGAKGLKHKALMLLVVAISYLLDVIANEGNAMFASATMWFYISNEGVSMLENLALCGVPIPPRIRQMLEKLAEGKHEEIEEASNG